MIYMKGDTSYTAEQIKAMHPGVVFSKGVAESLGYTFHAQPGNSINEVSLRSSFDFVIGYHLDNQARKFGYRDVHSAMAFVGSPVTKYHNEAVAFRDWASAVWEETDMAMQDILSGARKAVSPILFVDELPKFVAPSYAERM